MATVIYNDLAAGSFFLSYEAMKKFNKLGFKDCDVIPRHHPLLVSLYEKDKKALAGVGCRLNKQEVIGSVYTIVNEFGREKIKEPEDIKWNIITS